MEQSIRHQQRQNKALHPTAYSPLVPRSLSAAGELGRSAVARGLATCATLLNMVTISADEMQKDLPSYLRLVKTGETLVITQADEPVAEVKPVAQVTHEPRPCGLCAGEFVVPDDFNAPLPDDVLDAFEGR